MPISYAGGMARDSTERPTVQLSPSDVISWPHVIAALERMAPWAVLALRLGTLALLQECTRAMAQQSATAAQVVRARELVEALARMPWG